MTEEEIATAMETFQCSRQQAVARVWIADRVEGKPQPKEIPVELACPSCGTLRIPCGVGHDE